MADIDRKKKELLGLIVGLAELEERYGYMHAVEDLAAFDTYGNEKHMKEVKKEIKVVMDAIRKIVEEL
jgi:hypothetical protein